MTEKSVRHMVALMEELTSGQGDVHGLLRRTLEAGLASLMEAEVSEQIGAVHGERSVERLTHRNGYRDRRFDTGLGTSVLKIPKLRQGTYMPSFLTSKKRSDDALLAALVACYEQGVSTRKVEAVLQALGVENISKSAVSRVTAELSEELKVFRARPLPECPYVFVDARYEFVRSNHQVQKMAVLVALGIRNDGAREVLGYEVAPCESLGFWEDFLRSLKRRGLSGVKLVVSDAHEGLKGAIASVFPESLWQRCKVHFLRNLGSRFPRRRRPAFISLAKSIFQQDTLDEARRHRAEVAKAYRRAGQDEAALALEAADEVLTYMNFPRAHWSKLHSTNAVERLNRELKRRTRVVSIFPNRASLERLVGALLLEEHDENLVSRRVLSEESMQSLKTMHERVDDEMPGASSLLVTSSEPQRHHEGGQGLLNG